LNPLYEGSWWGEGEVKFFLDGDAEYPTLVGTGTEDYVGTAWGQGVFSQRFQGRLLHDKKARRGALLPGQTHDGSSVVARKRRKDRRVNAIVLRLKTPYNQCR